MVENREKGWVSKGLRKLLGVVDVFMFLTVVIASWVQTYVKLIKVYTLKIGNLLYMHYTSKLKN